MNGKYFYVNYLKKGDKVVATRNTRFTEKIILDFLREQEQRYNFRGYIIGISGGIDSAVVGKLACMAFGKEKVFGLLLPERDSSPQTMNDSLEVCSFLGIEYQIKKITPVLRSMGVYRLQPPAGLFPRFIQEKYVRGKWNEVSKEDTFIEDLKNEGSPEFLKGLAYYRAKHRVRMCMLYLEAEKRGYAVLGTTNRTELETGFYVKWGDDSSDIEPIMHLYKTQVFKLAENIGVPDKFIRKPPSPDLVPGITDEFALKISYKELDSILTAMDNNLSLENFDPVQVKRVLNIRQATKFRNIRNIHL